ncbi:hypothetical protein NDI56_17510 [Haloarcula sp. S1CR25-12]|uniref:Uncharacterized protein n=1 Tax=Haloarcula saliterrae TaxID=2950534 RepID=A0ABU2FHN2_9EURY|nr:hypothetical protein [Haloarcula sp. S1CR25-12]MDS0261200.1 hypothetical protein [Haloarcula sp. S1CR25-12]
MTLASTPTLYTSSQDALESKTRFILGTAIYATDLVRRRFVLPHSEDDPTVDEMAVAEGVPNDD